MVGSGRALLKLSHGNSSLGLFGKAYTRLRAYIATFISLESTRDGTLLRASAGSSLVCAALIALIVNPGE